MKTKWMILPVVALTLGCSREIDTNVTYIDGEFTLYATSVENDTRTVLQQDGRVFWSPSDCITVFYGNVPGMFTSTNTEPAASAQFTGSLGSFAIDGETEFRAIYPHSNDIVTPTDEGILSIGLPWEQTGVEGTFADDLFICVAKSKDVNLHFYNVCGGVKFSLARGDIKKVVFRGNNRETLAGRMAVEFDSNGIPQVTDMTGGKSSVTLLAPDGGTFKAGSFYYLVLVPQSLTKGYSMELWTDELVETVSSEASVTVRRAAWGVLKNLGNDDTPMAIPEAIDLGLPSGIKWASFNLGASKPEEFGDYYSWGETKIKENYTWKTYEWCNGSNDTMTKYCKSATSGYNGYGYNGFKDGKTELDPEDDVAHLTLEGHWKTPSDADWIELLVNCYTSKTTENGVFGRRFTSRINGNSIFFPAAGLRYGDQTLYVAASGSYWSSTLKLNHQDQAYAMSSGSDNAERYSANRYFGFSIRPVYDNSQTKPEIISSEPVDLGLSVKWAPFNLGATRPEEDGDLFAWGETEPYYSSKEPMIWKVGKEAGYSWSSYKWNMGSLKTLTKYCTDASYGYEGFTDGKTTLDPEDDAARVILGGKWRMPTVGEIMELMYNGAQGASMQWTYFNGVAGFKYTAPNGNSLFLPAVGMSGGYGGDYCYYWTSSLYSKPDQAWYGFRSYLYHGYDPYTRYSGLPIRPVYDDK